jgi:hypothetical protein
VLKLVKQKCSTKNNTFMDSDLLWNGLWWGVVGTFGMSILMMTGTLTGMSPMPKPIPLAIINKTLGEDKPKPLRMGLALLSHFAYGGFWGIVFAYVVEDPSIWKGLILGTALWLIMQVVVLPFLDWGMFGKKVTMKIAMATLILHLVYGGIVGWMAA